MDFVASLCSCVKIPEASQEALAYYTSGNYLWIAVQCMSFVIPGLFLIKKLGLRLETLSWRLGKSWFLALALFLTFYLCLGYILELPLEIYAGYFREKAYGLSRQSFGQFFLESLKGFAIGIITYVSTIWVFYWIVRRQEKKWWIYGACLSSCISFIAMFVQPLWIDPLFNDFSRMKNPVLESRILDLAQKAGIEGSRVFEVDKSRQTNLLNAYVTGLGHANRIVLWDTLLNKMTEEEVLFVMGHEMGHYVLKHIWKALVLEFFLNLAVFYFIFAAGGYVLKKYGSALGIQTFAQFSSFPLVVLLFLVASFLVNPLMLAISRHFEHQADIFGLEITQNNAAAGEAFVKLQSTNLSNPYPGTLYKIFRGSHPSLADRILFTNEYCPWKQGEKLQYQSYFSNTQ